MPIFAVNMVHFPESCPMFNSDVREKVKKTVIIKGEDIAKKHRIKILSAVASVLDHHIFCVIESDSQIELEEYLKEVGYAFWNSIEIKQVRFVEDVFKKL
jgi:archaellum biogenesis ATPase FlaH